MPEARSNVDMGIIDPMQQQHMDNPPAYAVHHQQQPKLGLGDSRMEEHYYRKG